MAATDDADRKDYSRPERLSEKMYLKRLVKASFRSAHQHRHIIAHHNHPTLGTCLISKGFSREGNSSLLPARKRTGELFPGSNLAIVRV